MISRICPYCNEEFKTLSLTKVFCCYDHTRKAGALKRRSNIPPKEYKRWKRVKEYYDDQRVIELKKAKEFYGVKNV